MDGISSANFHAAYGSKQQLYREALDRYLTTHGRVVAPLHDSGLPPRDRIERTLRASARTQSDGEHPLGCMVTLSATIGSTQSEGVRQTTAAVRRANREATGRAVHEAVANVILREDAARGLAVVLDMALNGLTLIARDGADSDKLDGAVDAAKRAGTAPFRFSHSSVLL